MLDPKVLTELKAYVERSLNRLCCSRAFVSGPQEDFLVQGSPPSELEEYVAAHRQPDFRQVLFSFIDQKGFTDSDVYTKAGIDRRHFSKIRSNREYKIGRNSAIALALALELGRYDMDKLLGAAGYSLSDTNTFDLVILFCLEKRIYDLRDVNQALDYFSLKPLSCAAE